MPLSMSFPIESGVFYYIQPILRAIDLPPEGSD